jgi:hypothetical protein
MPKIIVMRHGYRWSYEDRGACERDPRFIENPSDEPLGPRGFAESRMAARAVMEKAGVDRRSTSDNWELYSSPFARCIQTAGIVANEFETISRKPIKVKVEYSLIEPIPQTNAFVYDVNGTVRTKPEKYWIYEGVKLTTPIDRLLLRPALLTRYPGIIDESYVMHPKSNYSLPRLKATSLASKWFAKKVLNLRPAAEYSGKNVIIITHLFQTFALYGMLKSTRRVTDEEIDEFGGPRGTNVMFMYDTDTDKIVYGPTNEFLSAYRAGLIGPGGRPV